MGLTSARKIELAQKYGVECWGSPEIQRLLNRPACLSLQEGQQVGVEVLVRMLELKWDKDTDVSAVSVLVLCLFAMLP
jgi:hypothetical protein